LFNAKFFESDRARATSLSHFQHDVLLLLVNGWRTVPQR
jgi:hypothetical protein